MRVPLAGAAEVVEEEILLPDPPVMPEAEFDAENIWWVEHPVDVRTAGPCCPGD